MFLIGAQKTSAMIHSIPDPPGVLWMRFGTQYGHRNGREMEMALMVSSVEVEGMGSVKGRRIAWVRMGPVPVWPQAWV